MKSSKIQCQGSCFKSILHFFFFFSIYLFVGEIYEEVREQCDKALLRDFLVFFSGFICRTLSQNGSKPSTKKVKKG
jgi:hypothetical protein